MTQPGSRCPICGAPMEKQPSNPPEPSAAKQQEEAREIGVPDERSSVGRETDHRGVVMPRRTRIGGIIMPQ